MALTIPVFSRSVFGPSLVKGVFSLLCGFLCIVTLGLEARADSAREIDASVDTALGVFAEDVSGGREFLKSAKGYLVFPKVIKAGIGIGGEYGEGALRVKGKTVAYYRLTAASYGFQLGAQKKSIVLAFMTNDSLQHFRTSAGWQVGVDASVALIKVGAGGSIDTNTVKNPVVGFVFGQKGLMYDLSLEGTKFTKIKK